MEESGQGSARSTRARPGGAGSKKELIPREFLRIIAVWSLIPSYLIAGGLVGYVLDGWFDAYPYITGLALLVSLVLAIRDMLRLRESM